MSEDIIRVTASVAPSVAPSSESEQVSDFLAFRLAHEFYALPLRSVREILKPPPITEVPRAPRDVLGIISVRGRVTTVIDLRRRLSMPEEHESKNSRVLLTDTGAEVMGLWVDEVLQVYRLASDEMELAASVGGDTAEYVLGVGRPRGARSLGRAVARSRGEGEVRTDELLILLAPRPLLRR